MEENSDVLTVSNKRIALEDLSKEELIKRCKSYLVLAQKAKSARDESHQQESEMHQKILNLEDKINGEKSELMRRIEGLRPFESENLLLSEKLSALTSNLKDRDNEKGALNSKIATLQNKLEAMEEMYGQQKDGFVEELNKMNIILKQRGEAITQLEEQCLSDNKDFKVKTDNFLQCLSEKDKRIDQLEGEINHFENHSEMMSTSTICKSEEVHRMKDVEDSLEERYQKLKMLAVKLKKKVAEQNAHITSFKIPLNLQALQKEIDRLNDELDAQKTEMSLIKKDCDSAICELVNSRQRAEEFKTNNCALQTTIANLQKSNQSLDMAVKDLMTEVDDLKKNQDVCDHLKKDIVKLNSMIDELNLNNQMVALDSEKQNLLQLEVSDYERKLKETNHQLECLQEQLQKSETNQMLMKTLQETIDNEQEKSNQLQIRLKDVELQLGVLREENSKQEKEIDELSSQALTRGHQIDNLKLELSVANTEQQKLVNESSLHQDSLRKQVAALEARVLLEEKEKKMFECHLGELRSEYENYKIRATSVFKKQKTEGQAPAQHELSNNFNTDKVECDMLQRLVDALKLKISQLESNLLLSQSEVVNLRAEKERLNADTVKTVETFEQRLQQSEVFKEVAKREHEAIMAQFHADNQLLAALHREQIDGLKDRHSREVMLLQNQLDTSKAEVSKLQVSISSKAVSFPAKNPSSADSGNVDCDPRESFQPLNSVRPASAEDNSRRPMPLELLLNSTLVLEERQSSSHHDESTEESTAAAHQHLMESMTISEKQCKHLAALLAESEANEARLSQLTEALKEEIRRTQRSEERQKHIENLEYLKNVVLKFVTLPRGEERSRLVPVLTTLLRLSPNEVQEVHQTLSKCLESTTPRPMAWGGVFNLWAPSP